MTKQQSFDLHMVLQDVSSKIMSFSQNGPRAICILSANGSISNVTLRQPATSGGTVTYEVCAPSFCLKESSNRDKLCVCGILHVGFRNNCFDF